MVKLKRIWVVAAFASVMLSCDGNKGSVVYSGHKWDVVRVNDSVLLVVPGLNSSKDAAPVVVKLNGSVKLNGNGDEKE